MIDPQATWYKDAVIYEVHVRAFSDTTDDGHGDVSTADIPSDVWHGQKIWVLPPDAKVPKKLPTCRRFANRRQSHTSRRRISTVNSPKPCGHALRPGGRCDAAGSTRRSRGSRSSASCPIC